MFRENKGAAGKSRYNYNERTNKCNLFVYDVLDKADHSNPNRTRFGINRGPINVQSWFDGIKDGTIKGFEAVDIPQAGDLVAVRYPYSDASGHIAVVLDPILQTSIGAGGAKGSYTGGWPWNQGAPQPKEDSDLIYIRCID